MAHVAPHRWADVATGRVSDLERARLERHAATCVRCATVRARVVAARAACAAIAASDPPPLHWDHIGARIYWVTSSEQRASNRPARARRRPILLAAGLGMAAMAAAALFAIPRLTGDSGSPRPAAAPLAAEQPVVPVEVVAAPLQGVVVFAQGEVEVDGAPLEIDALLGGGARLTTGDGTVAIQFGAGSGLALGPRSSLELRSFDERRVALVLDGLVAVDLAPQPPDRSFAVVVGEREVVVRGTAFQVDYRGGALEVSCLHGKVAVRDGVAEVDVVGGHRLQLAAGALITDGGLRAASREELVGLERAVAVPLLPAWPEASALYETSAVLELAGEPDLEISVDGVQRGGGPFLLRVMSGRHHVATGGRGGWVEAAPGARIEVAPSPAPSAPAASRGGAALRHAQIDRGLDHGLARQCLWPLEKQGLVEGSYIVLDIGVTAGGSISHLNIVKSNLPAEVARCVRDRVDAVTLPAGPSATVRYRLGF